MLQQHCKLKELAIPEVVLHDYFLGSLLSYITTYAFPIYNVKTDRDKKKKKTTHKIYSHRKWYGTDVYYWYTDAFFHQSQLDAASICREKSVVSEP